ncbi:hypothetical protein CF319_g1609 [Tilletia indica]|nr:hypothetical protein CF319_g1609 [Tilletia indica]
MPPPPRDASPPVVPEQPPQADPPPPLAEDLHSRQVIARYVAAYNETNGCPQLYHGAPMSDDVGRHPLYRCPLVEMNIRRRFEEFFVHYTCVTNRLRLDATWTRENILTLLRSIVTEGLLVIPDVDADMRDNLTSGTFRDRCYILGHAPYPFRDGSGEELPASAPFPCRQCWRCARVTEPGEPAVSETGLGEDGSDVAGPQVGSGVRLPSLSRESPVDPNVDNNPFINPFIGNVDDADTNERSPPFPSLDFLPVVQKDPGVDWAGVRRILGPDDSVDSESSRSASPASLALNLVPAQEPFRITSPVIPAEPASSQEMPSSSQGSSAVILSQSSGSSTNVRGRSERAGVAAGKRKQVTFTDNTNGDIENRRLAPSALASSASSSSSRRPYKRGRYVTPARD